MLRSWGVFREIYRGQGIYWAGTFNIEGRGEFKTISSARTAIDGHVAAYESRELQSRLRQVRSGAIACVRDGDNVTVHTEPVCVMTIRQFRQSVFDIEERENRDTVMLSQSEFDSLCLSR